LLFAGHEVEGRRRLPSNQLCMKTSTEDKQMSTDNISNSATVRLDVSTLAPGISLNRLWLDGWHDQAAFDKSLLMIETLEGETVKFTWTQ